MCVRQPISVNLALIIGKQEKIHVHNVLQIIQNLKELLTVKQISTY
jgi:hypothetical protein